MGAVRRLIGGLAALLIAGLHGCAAAPQLPAGAASASAAMARASSTQDVARGVAVTGPRGRLTQAQRERVLRRIEGQGRASLLQRQLAAMTAFGDVDLYADNGVQLLIDGPATFEAMFKAIGGARRSVLIESYIVEDADIAQRLADLLVRKRSEGVDVALLYDAVGSFSTEPAYFERLTQAGVQVCAYNPIMSTREKAPQSPTHRDHRKIIAVDRQIGFAGGINISAVYSSGSFGRTHRRAAPPAPGRKDDGWRDTHVLVRGPAAEALEDAVRRTWVSQACPGALQPASPAAKAGKAGPDLVQVLVTGPDDEYSRIYAALLTAIDTAQHSIDITMAYFAPGDDMIDALCEAARRGVLVRMVLPSQSDFKPVLHAGRARYDELLEAKVQLFELQGAVLHAKTAVVDGVWSTVGSSNMDYRSFVGNNEVNVIVLGEDFGQAMGRMFEQDLAASKPVRPQDWQERPWSQRLIESAARLFERWW
jgi:cardiolipin synthase A/B